MQDKSVFSLLRERMREMLFVSYSSGYSARKREDGAEALTALLTLPGRVPDSLRFSDIDYTSENRSNWPLLEVLRRALALSSAAARGGDTERKRLLPLISAILRDWVSEGYPNSNWWQHEIGVPMVLTELLLLVGDGLDEDAREGAYRFTLPGVIAGNPKIAARADGRYQGANLLWFCATSLRHAALTEDEAELRTVSEMAAAEAYGTPGEVGLQPDGSFLQHGKQLYSLGYGRSFLSESSTLLYLLSGTEYAYPQGAVEQLLIHLLDGIRYMIAGKGIDFTACGREYIRDRALSSRSLLPSLDCLLAVEGIPRRDELLSLRRAIAEERLPACGVKYFDTVKYLSLYTDRLHFAFKGSDPSLVNTEIVNNENVLGYNLSYGTVSLVMRTGGEYFDIPTYMDYARIPGTTARIEDDAALRRYTDLTRKLPTEDFGGRAEGDLGAAYLTTRHEGVSATVSAFATPFGAVLLGCGLSEDEGAPLQTTVNQCRAEAGGFRLSDGGKAVLHGGVCYTNLDPETEFFPEIRHLFGSLKRNYLNAEEVLTEGDLFSLTIPVSKEHPAYAYAVTAEEDGSLPFTVLSNTRELQAILLPDGRGIAVVHAAGCRAPEGSGIDTARAGVIFF